MLQDIYAKYNNIYVLRSHVPYTPTEVVYTHTGSLTLLKLGHSLNDTLRLRNCETLPAMSLSHRGTAWQKLLMITSDPKL